MSNVRQRLEEAVEGSGLTKYAIEKAAGLERGHLSTIIRMGSLSRDTAARIAAVLGVSAGWLLAGDVPKEPQAKTLHAEPVPMDAALEASFDAKRHKLSDALAVQELLRSGLVLFQPEQASALTEALLDAAQARRVPGHERRHS